MNHPDYPPIVIYRYHLMGFYHSTTTANVEAVVASIKATVSPGHPEYEPLLETGRNRWMELNESKEAK